MEIKARNKYMQAAIEEAYAGINARHGGPFASVIVKDGEIVGYGHNRVLSENDPTRHGEVDAIRSTCQKLGTHDLSGYELYTTGEPCPMCLFACMWAGIEKIYYGCNLEDNSMIGFRDKRFDELGGGREKLKDYLECIDREACLKLFEDYNSSEHEMY